MVPQFILQKMRYLKQSAQKTSLNFLLIGTQIKVL